MPSYPLALPGMLFQRGSPQSHWDHACFPDRGAVFFPAEFKHPLLFFFFPSRENTQAQAGSHTLGTPNSLSQLRDSSLSLQYLGVCVCGEVLDLFPHFLRNPRLGGVREQPGKVLPFQRPFSLPGLHTGPMDVSPGLGISSQHAALPSPGFLAAAR